MILLTSCSNFQKTTLSKSQEMMLNKKIKKIQGELKNNNLKTLSDSLNIPVKKKYILSELSSYDLSKVKIYFTAPEIVGNKAYNVVGMRYGEEVLYYNLEYEYLKDDWDIVKFTERR